MSFSNRRGTERSIMRGAMSVGLVVLIAGLTISCGGYYYAEPQPTAAAQYGAPQAGIHAPAPAPAVGDQAQVSPQIAPNQAVTTPQVHVGQPTVAGAVPVSPATSPPAPQTAAPPAGAFPTAPGIVPPPAAPAPAKAQFEAEDQQWARRFFKVVHSSLAFPATLTPEVRSGLSCSVSVKMSPEHRPREVRLAKSSGNADFDRVVLTAFQKLAAGEIQIPTPPAKLQPALQNQGFTLRVHGKSQ